MAKRYHQADKMATITRGCEEWTIPMIQWLLALDKVTTLAWVSSDYQTPTAFNWHDEEITIAPAPRFPYPLTQDPDELLAHLHFYGIMTEYNADIPAKECASAPMDHVKLRRIEKNARAVGRPTFLQVFIENIGHIAPPLSRFRGLSGGMKYDPAKHRLTFRLVTFDQSALWQDFRITWTDGLAELEVLSLDAIEKIPVWVDYDTCDLAEPTCAEPTDNLDDLLPQAEWINANLTDRWGGKRPNAGRKGNRTSGVSARVPEAILEKLKAEAEADGISVSAKVAEILANWSKRHK